MSGSIDAVAALVRAFSFIYSLGATGLTIFLLLYRALAERSRERIRFYALGFGVIAFVAVVVAQSLQAARMIGDYSGLLDAGTQSYNWTQSAGIAALLRSAGLVLLCVSVARAGHFARRCALLGVVLVVFSFPATGHTSQQANHWVWQFVLAAHLGAAAYWFGGLPALLRVLRTETVQRAAIIVRRFSQHATRVFVALGIAGGVLVVTLLPGFEAFTRPYGQLLLTKMAGYTVLLGLAALNKVRFTPRLALGEGSAVTALRWSIRIEFVLGCVVLAVTAVMTGFYAPDDAM